MYKHDPDHCKCKCHIPFYDDEAMFAYPNVQPLSHSPYYSHPHQTYSQYHYTPMNQPTNPDGWQQCRQRCLQLGYTPGTNAWRSCVHGCMEM